MTRLRQIAMAGLAAIAIGGVASSASAMETGTFQNRLNGATIGLPLGALPPPGLYTGLSTAYLGMLGPATSTPALATSARALGRRRCALPASPSGASAVGAGLVLLRRQLLGVDRRSLLRLHDLQRRRLQRGWRLYAASDPIGGGFVYTNLFCSAVEFVVECRRRLVHRRPPSRSRRRPVRGRTVVSLRTPTTGPSNRRCSFSYLGSNWVASANFFYDINTQSARLLLRGEARSPAVTHSTAI